MPTSSLDGNRVNYFWFYLIKLFIKINKYLLSKNHSPKIMSPLVPKNHPKYWVRGKSPQKAQFNRNEDPK